MPRPSASRPTDGELSILRILWQHGGQSVRNIRRSLLKQSGVTHQSVQARLEIMLRKGYVRRDDRERPHIYYAEVSEDRTKGELLKDMVRVVFGGSVKSLVMHTLRAGKTTSAELAEIRQRLDELDRAKK